MTGTHTLVLGWAGSTNLGDELIVRAVADLVLAAGGQPTVVTVDPEQSAELQVPLVRHAGAFDTVALAAAAGRHTAAVFGGGGLIQDETGPLNLPFHLTRLTAARARRLPWAGLALGFGAVRRRSSRLLVRALLRGSVAMSVRDEASVQRCRDLTGLTPLLAADPVLGTTADTVAPTDHLVVSLRRANLPGQRRLATSDPVDATRVRRWANLIDEVAARHDLAVRFVAWERVQDQQLHRAVADRLRTEAVLETPGPAEIVGRMGAGRLVLSMRYHGAVAALLHGRPAIVLDYSPKMGDLVAESRGGLALAPLDVDAAGVLGHAERIIPRADQRAAALAALRSRADRNAGVVETLLDRATLHR